MKKIILWITIILILVASCFGIYLFINNDKKADEPKENKTEEKQEVDEEKEPEYVDNNPIVVGLYKNYHNGKERELIKEYNAKWEYHKDISSFEVFYTNEELISSKNQIQLIDEYKNKYSNIDNYRIGYLIEFSIGDNKINKTILRPKDSEEFFDYLEIYLYDDYHRNGSWYSHTTEEEMNEETLLTSIKLTAGKKVNEITSDIELTAFTYDSDDFTDDGYYKGISKYSIIVKNNNN